MALVKLEDFDVSPTRGFVPENPLVKLPEYFSHWEEVCSELPALWKNGTTRSVIEKLPLLDHERLSSEREWYRAHAVLTGMTQSYVWCHGEPGAAKMLPKCIAVPLYGVSRHTGLPLVINHCNALCNWKQASHDSDLELIHTLTGTKSEEGFFLTALRVELEFGKGGAPCLVKGQQAVLNDDIDTVIHSLISLQDIIHNMRSAFLKTHDVVDPKEFYNVLRPFLNGWNENSILEDGLVYEGVSTKPMKYFGGSAAQSPAFQAIDGFLGIPHQTKTGDEHFLTKMRMYMFPKHRAFIEVIEHGPSIKDFVFKKKNDLLTEKYNGCVDAMEKYRDAHLNVVVKYITIQANRNPSNPNIKLSNTGTGGSVDSPLRLVCQQLPCNQITRQPDLRSGSYKKSRSPARNVKLSNTGTGGSGNPNIKLSNTGTGGSDLLPFLKKIRNETKEQRIDQTTTEHNQ